MRYLGVGGGAEKCPMSLAVTPSPEGEGELKLRDTRFKPHTSAAGGIAGEFRDMRKFDRGG